MRVEAIEHSVGMIKATVQAEGYWNERVETRVRTELANLSRPFQMPPPVKERVTTFLEQHRGEYFTHEEMAHELSTSRETVTRAMIELGHRGRARP